MIPYVDSQIDRCGDGLAMAYLGTHAHAPRIRDFATMSPVAGSLTVLLRVANSTMRRTGELKAFAKYLQPEIAGTHSEPGVPWQ
jgi:hypothetical protein